MESLHLAKDLLATDIFSPQPGAARSVNWRTLGNEETMLKQQGFISQGMIGGSHFQWRVANCQIYYSSCSLKQDHCNIPGNEQRFDSGTKLGCISQEFYELTAQWQICKKQFHEFCRIQLFFEIFRQIFRFTPSFDFCICKLKV